MEFRLSKSLIKSTNRHFFNTFLVSNSNPLKTKNSSNFTFTQHTPTCTLTLLNPTSFLRFSFPNLKPLLSFNPFSFITNSLEPIVHVIVGNKNNPPSVWSLTSVGQNDVQLGYGSEDKKPAVTVVVLGWLGCDQIQLRKYADMYNMFGVNVVTFATSVNDVLGFMPPIRLEVLVHEIMEWMQYKDDDDRERFLVFHTFSNFGWLAYGAILKILQGREEILKKIIGCVVDSGGVPELNPKVWATEFTTAVFTMLAEPCELQDAVNTDDEFLSLEAEFVATFEKIITEALESRDEELWIRNNGRVRQDRLGNMSKCGISCVHF